MSDLVQEISTDYDRDPEVVAFDQAFGDDIDRLNKDTLEFEGIENELRQLTDAGLAIEAFGINPTAFAIMKTTGLLSGTALNAVATETFGFEGPESAESEMALESLMDKIKDKASHWAARILDMAKSIGGKVTALIEPLWEKITGFVKKLSGVAWDKTKVLGAKIKAHPYATVAAAVGATVVVAGIVAFIASGVPGPYANESALQTFKYKIEDMVKNIKWPFGKGITIAEGASKVGEVNLHGHSIKYKQVFNVHIDQVKSSGLASTEVANLGWTQSAVRSLSGNLSRVWAMLKKSLYTVGLNIAHFADKGMHGLMKYGVAPGLKASEKVGAATSKAFGGGKVAKVAGSVAGMIAWQAWVSAIVVSLNLAIRLIYHVVVATFRMIGHVLSELVHVVLPKPAAA